MEYEVLSYLHRKGLPVPKPYHLESREGVIGTEFFIMEYVDVSQGVFTDVCENLSLFFSSKHVTIINPKPGKESTSDGLNMEFMLLVGLSHCQNIRT